MGHRDKNFHNQMMRRRGLRTRPNRIQELYLAGRKDEAADAVPDEWVDMKALIGPPARIKQRFRAWADSGATAVTVRTRNEEAVRIVGEAARLNRETNMARQGRRRGGNRPATPGQGDLFDQPSPRLSSAPPGGRAGYDVRSLSDDKLLARLDRAGSSEAVALLREISERGLTAGVPVLHRLWKRFFRFRRPRALAGAVGGVMRSCAAEYR